MLKKNKNTKNTRGIIAIFPAIIISSLLIILSVSASQSFLAHLYRTMIFDQKIQTDILVKACALRVRAKLLQNENYSGKETISFKTDPAIDCSVGNFDDGHGRVSIKFGDAASMEEI